MASPSWRGVVATILILLGCSAMLPAAAETGVQVILSADHKDLQVDRTLLLSVYIGRITTWPDGQPTRVFTLADDHPLHVQFCRQMLGTYPYVLRNAWNKLVYTGTGFAPTAVANEQEMRRRVNETVGAIGYVSAAQAALPHERLLASLKTQVLGASNE